MKRLFTCHENDHVVAGEDVYLELNALAFEQMYGKVKDDLDDFKDAVNEKGAKGNSLAFKDSRYQEEMNYEYTTVIDYFERRKR